MKKVLLLLFLTFSAQGFSQASASASLKARVQVVDPIRITKSVDLNFGNVIGSHTAGSLTLTPDGTRIADGVQIPTSDPGEFSPAEAVVAHGNNNYSISLPESFTLINESNPNQVMILDDFTVAPRPGEAGFGTDVLKIGATLNLEANQRPGNYTSTTGFNVTVAYN